MTESDKAALEIFTKTTGKDEIDVLLAELVGAVQDLTLGVQPEPTDHPKTTAKTRR